MKILTLWLWAFGFAINKVLWENNPDNKFYAYELNDEVSSSIKNTRKHPFFFEWYFLPENIEIIDSLDDIIWDIDLLIIAIPVQFINNTILWLKNKFKNWVTILNLAKWIDIKSNKTISQLIWEIMWDFEYDYAILSGWMIASDVVEGKLLGADLGVKSYIPQSNPLLIGEKIKALLENKNLKIKLREDVVNIELYWSLKNIAAILVWYYEGAWYNASTIWYKLVDFYDEMKELVWIYGWNKTLDFSYYSLWWDIVATCFWKSRNRYFWRLLWEWKDILEILDILKSENKHAEGYETLKAVYKMIEDKKWFENIKFLFGLVR